MTGTDQSTLNTIETALRADGVWVAPDMAKQVPRQAETRIEQAVAHASQPFYVVVARLDEDDPLTGGRADMLAGLVVDDTHLTGTYIGLDAIETHELEIVQRPAHRYDLFYAGRVARLEHPSDLAASIVDTIELIDSGQDLEAAYEQAQKEHPQLYQQLYGYMTGTGSSTGGSAHDSGAGSGHAVVIGVVSALVVAALGAAVMVRARRRRGSLVTSLSSSTSHRPLALPEAVLRAVRAAEDERNEGRAEQAVLALGEAIDKATLAVRSDQARAAWQAALDHYDVASRILDREHSPADAVGAIVLAERGQSALRAARKGRGWAPAKQCYFNPLHGAATRELDWTDDRHSVRVPACARCATALRSGREPEDILDFVAQGEPRHYFRLDLGAWSRTGYGSLNDDLLGALLHA